MPVVRGGAVAWYTAINATTGVGTINLWSKATGPKLLVSTTAIAGVFTASADGTRVAFGVGATPIGAPTATGIAITDTATASPTAVLTGVGNRMNLAAAAKDCSPDIAFVGRTFFGAYCTGTAAASVNAQLVTVPGTSTTPAVLIDNSPGIQPFWQPDTAGAKLFVIGLANGANNPDQGRIVTVAGGGITTLDDNTLDGFMLGDGSAAIWQVGTALKTGLTAAGAKTLDEHREVDHRHQQRRQAHALQLARPGGSRTTPSTSARSTPRRRRSRASRSSRPRRLFPSASARPARTRSTSAISARPAPS